MCRIFAFKSRVSLKVQRSLVKADNALQIQSEKHPHGWGISYYLTNELEPHEVKSLDPASTDDRFRKVSEFLTSHAVLAHVRKATVGDLSLLNTHPFHWNGWSFCHNGTMFGFDSIRDRFEERIAPRFLPLIQGTTDSEVLFFLVLTALEKSGFDVDQPASSFPDSTDRILGELLCWIRDLCAETGADEREAMLNFVLTNGRILLANRFNGGLHFSTQKKRCADFDVCPIANKVCFGPRRVGIRHTHLLIASDPTSPDDVWEEIPNRGIAMLDEEFRLSIKALQGVTGPDPWFSN
ncbi:MAG: class II glutamine amidotransferase [Deltaproteobacteria bacterium]|nr:class II glutamine amidotransferase [Deltaproteobacteria bacterium]